MNYSKHLLHHIRRDIGHNIHRLRVSRKLPLVRLSELTGIPSDRLDQYEIGKNQLFFEHLVQIACALKVNVEALFKNRIC